MFSKRTPPEESVASWATQSDGSLVAVNSNCKYIPCSDGTYELEFGTTDAPMGLILETNSYGNYAIVKNIASDSADVLKRVVNIGDVVVAVNNHIMIHEDFSDVITFLDMLREGQLARRVRLLNPKKCPVAIYAERVEMQQRCHKDMFGFLRSLEYLQKEQQWKAARVAIDAQRDIDWVEYLKSIGGPENLKPSGMFRASKELKQLVRRGIPVAYRALLWPKLSLASRYKAKYPSRYYHELLKRKGELDPKVEVDIDKDTDRTFPEHDYYGCGGGCEVLKRVLVAHALHNPAIGYCQSLNFVAGMILLFLQEEEAFWLFVTVVDTLLPHDYYTSSMVGTYIDQFVFAHVIKTRLPEIHRVLEAASLQLPLITVQWFMCLFVNALPPESALRVWDMFLNEGCKVLFRIAVGLFKIHEKQLLAAKDAGEIYSVLKGMGRNVIDADALIAAAYRSYKPPVKRANMVYASSQNGKGLHSDRRGASSSNAAGAGKSRQERSSGLLSPTGAGGGIFRTSSWIASQVPGVLVGIGLAHLGPKPEAATATSKAPDNAPANSLTSVVGSIFGARDKVLQECAQVSGSGASNGGAGSVVDGSSVSNATAAANNIKKLGKHRDYRSFSRLDIEKWRAQFRPQVEERFNTMERARVQWREKEEQESLERERNQLDSTKKPGIGLSSSGANGKNSAKSGGKFSNLVETNLITRNNILESEENSPVVKRNNSGGRKKALNLVVQTDTSGAVGDGSGDGETEADDDTFSVGAMGITPLNAAGQPILWKDKDGFASPKSGVDYSLDIEEKEPEIYPDEPPSGDAEDSVNISATHYSSDEEEADYQKEHIDPETSGVAYTNSNRSLQQYIERKKSAEAEAVDDDVVSAAPPLWDFIIEQAANSPSSKAPLSASNSRNRRLDGSTASASARGNRIFFAEEEGEQPAATPYKATTRKDPAPTSLPSPNASSHSSESGLETPVAANSRWRSLFSDAKRWDNAAASSGSAAAGPPK